MASLLLAISRLKRRLKPQRLAAQDFLITNEITSLNYYEKKMGIRPIVSHASWPTMPSRAIKPNLATGKMSAA